ncbi:MAG: 5-(carboxyamino)imidazole ribonucleotide mutase [Candidatus Thermoplasmatota archaeon]|jgi:5-(carboxyamino)imidazole ribonucleotide mutase|nr:5-(carboxyamino)imidazole ribonucleotide mutase [Candidatus Thermoplasmatota archaeon]MCL5788882.1 5-(carboxyamino)imidazole ribonucleotide mutase [Candidatus Thermoplasmatota archaeon]
MSKVSVVMGSTSDLDVMKDAINTLKEFGINVDYGVYSAHRSPERLVEYCSNLKKSGIDVVIAGAGGAAALPGMIAALSDVPVIGVPIMGKSLNGLDSLLSIVQMPPGVPVATVGINASKNAALLAVRMIAISDVDTRKRLEEFIKKQKKEAAEKQLVL